MRLEGYSLVLVNSEGGHNLNSKFFNLTNDFDLIIQMHEMGFNLTKVFGIDVKVAYNTYVDYWKMTVNLPEISKKNLKF